MSNNFIKFFQLIVLLMISSFINTRAQDEIICDDGGCSIPPTMDVLYYGGGGNYTSFELAPQNGDIEVISTPGQRPESIRANIPFRDSEGHDIDINLMGSSNYDAGSVFLVSDIIDRIDLMLAGTIGEPGMSSTDLCGQNFITGVYGTDARDWFNARRDSDTSLVNRCDEVDIQWINENKFLCPTGYQESPFPDVPVTRFQARRQCQGVISRTRCVQRSYNIECRSNRVRKGCCDSINYTWDYVGADGDLTPTYVNSFCNPTLCEQLGESDWFRSGDIHFVTFRAWEHEILSVSPENLCRNKKNELEKPHVRFNVFEHEVEGDTNSPLIEVEYEEGTSDVRFFSAPAGPLDDNGYFLVPVPDVVYFPNHDDPHDFDFSNMRVKIHKNLSTIEVSNCFGLDGSAYTDRECLRTVPGSARPGGLVISYIDKMGVESNKLHIDVGASNSRICTMIGYRVEGGQPFMGSVYTLGEGLRWDEINGQRLGSSLPIARQSGRFGWRALTHNDIELMKENFYMDGYVITGVKPDAPFVTIEGNQIKSKTYTYTWGNNGVGTRAYFGSSYRARIGSFYLCNNSCFQAQGYWRYSESYCSLGSRCKGAGGGRCIKTYYHGSLPLRIPPLPQGRDDCEYYNGAPHAAFGNHPEVRGFPYTGGCE